MSDPSPDNGCKSLQIMLATFDLIIEFYSAVKLDELARSLNAAEIKHNNDLAHQIRLKTVEYSAAATACRNGGYPDPHPDLR